MAAKAKTKKSDDIYTLFEKGLKTLHDKGAEKALPIFQDIEEKFPDQDEILARTRVFRRICDRVLSEEEAAPDKKSPEELYDWGVFHHNQGAFDEAVDFYEHAQKAAKEDLDFVFYAMAAAQVQRGEEKKGLDSLKKAIEINSRNRHFASHDPDFETLSDKESFRDLVGRKK